MISQLHLVSKLSPVYIPCDKMDYNLEVIAMHLIALVKTLRLLQKVIAKVLDFLGQVENVLPLIQMKVIVLPTKRVG